MKVLMLADLPPELLQRNPHPAELWMKRFLPTPVLNLLESFARIPELEVHVLSFSHNGTIRGTLWQRIHVEIIWVPKGSGLSTFYLLRRSHVLKAIERLQPDLVHGQGIEAGYAWLATLQPVTHVLTFHGVYGVTAYLKPMGIWQRLGQMLQWITLQRARNIIAISHYLEEWFHKNTRANVHYIPNPINDRFYRIKPAKKTEFDLLYVGRITPAKGLLDAIEAIAQLEKLKGWKLKMAVVGKPTGSKGYDYMDLCNRRAKSLDRSKVVFLGSVPNEKLPEVLSNSKILVIPSYGENFSMTAAEASAAGLPVIGYRVGGLPTVVEHGKTGFLVSPGDILALSRAIENLIIDDNLRLRFGEAAKERAMHWHQHIVASQTVDFYTQLVSI